MLDERVEHGGLELVQRALGHARLDVEHEGEDVVDPEVGDLRQGAELQQQREAGDRGPPHQDGLVGREGGERVHAEELDDRARLQAHGRAEERQGRVEELEGGPPDHRLLVRSRRAEHGREVHELGVRALQHDLLEQTRGVVALRQEVQRRRDAAERAGADGGDGVGAAPQERHEELLHELSARLHCPPASEPPAPLERDDGNLRGEDADGHTLGL
mmetsp:Transcript_116633/g.330502  ORF Transcript_116633/g.330502 Transcript_116633/m.330502 type:complete len:216 (+) Transcript_116633:2701-3348(+)